MIRVPTVGVPDIQPEAMPSARIGNQVSAEGMGADIGQGLARLGANLDEFGRVEQEKADITTLNQARVALANKESSYFDPNNAQGLYSYKGQNALQAPRAIQQDFSEWSSNYLQDVKNPAQRAMVDHLFSERRLGLLDRTNTYALQQGDAAGREAFEGSVGSAALNWNRYAMAGDAAGAQAAQADGIATIKQYAAANGWPDSYTQFSIDKFVKAGQAANDAANKAAVEQSIVQDPESALHELGARLGVGQVSQDGQAVGGDPNAPRGIRNNNPGNIKDSGIAWQGAVPGTDPSYVSFGTPVAGIRALALNAYHMQQKDGAQTVGDLISKWAPESDNNDTQAYIADVSKQMGVNPSTPVDLQDPTQLTALTNAIITHENGQNPYSPEQVQQGVDAALGKGKLPETYPAVTVAGGGLVVPANGATPPGTLNQTGNFRVDALNTADTVALYNRAREAVNRNQVNMRSSIEQRVRDDTAAFLSGQSVAQPLTLPEFIQAYGDKEGMVAYGAYAANQQLGKDLATVNTLDQQQMMDLAKAREPVPGQNFAVKEADQKILIRAIQQTLTARAKDPVQWAETSGVGGIQQLDLSSPDKLADSIAARVAPMTTLAKQYQMPYELLTSTEQSALSQTMNGMPALQKAAFLGSLATKLDQPDMQRVLGSIKANSPVAATAGEIMAAGHAVQVGTTGSLWWKQPTNMQAADVAEIMLEGESIINPSAADKKAGAPKVSGQMPGNSTNGADSLLPTFNNAAGDAFRGNGALQMQEYQAYRAMYAGLAAKQGKLDGSLHADIAQQAAAAVLGNVVDWDGHNVLPPYGMSENAFTDAVNTQWSKVRDQSSGFQNVDAESLGLQPIPNHPGLYGMVSGGNPVLNKKHVPMAIRIAYPAAEPAATAAAPQAAKPAAQQPPMTLGQQVMENTYGNG